MLKSRSTIGEVEVFYYKLNNAVLLGDTDKAKMYLDILRNEYEKNESSFDELKIDGRWEHLKQLGNAVDNGLVIKNYEYDDNSDDVEEAKRDEDRADDERSLVKVICDNLDILRDILGATNKLYIYNIEHPTAYGRVDVVLKDGDTVYLVEIKKSHARYSVISQIDKYMLDFRLKLILKAWRKVVGVVIANGFIGRVSKELVKFGVIPIKYRIKNNTLSLRRLHAKT